METKQFNYGLKEDPAILVRCERCHRPLIERLPNGLWRFIYGRPWVKDEKTGKSRPSKMWIPVIIYIHGSVRIKCFRKDCEHWNILNFLPSVFSDETKTK